MNSIDVVVPCYRYGHFLRECVESVLAQGIPTLRVLILDDASPDCTAEVGGELAAADARVTYMRHCANKGHIATYNEGIEWAHADRLLLLSADDYLLPGALSRATSLMHSNPEVSFVFGNVVELGNDGAISRKPGRASVSNGSATRVLSGQQFIKLSGSHNIVSTPTVVVRTELQKRLGGYRKELPHTADMELWLRLAAHGPVGFIEDFQAVYRRHTGNMSLAYSDSNSLPDLEQRKAALDSFAVASGSSLANVAHLHRMLLKALARDAIGFASTAFNNGEMKACEELSQCALRICPDIKISLPWLKLGLKRRVGPTSWRVMQSMARSRQLTLTKKARST